MSETQPDLREALARDLAGELRDLAETIDGLDYTKSTYGAQLRDAAAQVSALQAKVERLQKVEGERDAALKAAAILLPFVDMAAGEGLEWSEQECGSPRMDAADLCVQAAEALGFDLGDDRYTALLKQGEDAIRAANPLTETKEGENV